MRLLMVSGDRQVAIGERGPFHAMQRIFSRHFERIDVLCPRPDRPVSVRTTMPVPPLTVRSSRTRRKRLAPSRNLSGSTT